MFIFPVRPKSAARKCMKQNRQLIKNEKRWVFWYVCQCVFIPTFAAACTFVNHAEFFFPSLLLYFDLHLLGGFVRSLYELQAWGSYIGFCRVFPTPHRHILVTLIFLLTFKPKRLSFWRESERQKKMRQKINEANRDYDCMWLLCVKHDVLVQRSWTCIWVCVFSVFLKDFLIAVMLLHVFRLHSSHDGCSKWKD